MNAATVTIATTIVRGHRVASGSGGDPRFPHGTLQLQFPIFAQHGLDLPGIHRATINLSIAPNDYKILEPKLTLTNIRWHPDCAAETFSFFDCQIAPEGAAAPTSGLIYYPHPETKPEHFQDPRVLEILAPKLDSISYGQKVYLTPDPQQLAIIPGPTSPTR